jgi:hypothetical protein
MGGGASRSGVRGCVMGERDVGNGNGDGNGNGNEDGRGAEPPTPNPYPLVGRVAA